MQVPLRLIMDAKWLLFLDDGPIDNLIKFVQSLIDVVLLEW